MLSGGEKGRAGECRSGAGGLPAGRCGKHGVGTQHTVEEEAGSSWFGKAIVECTELAVGTGAVLPGGQRRTFGYRRSIKDAEVPFLHGRFSSVSIFVAPTLR